MALTADAVTSVYDKIVSHASATGYFADVAGHEIKSSGPLGLVCMMWMDYLGPALGGAGSGLAETSTLLVLNARIEAGAFAPDRLTADAIDPKLLAAASALMGRLIGDLTLDGTAAGLVRTIDVRGMSGRRLEGRGGYLDRDGKLKRLINITVPIILNDAWTEAP